MALTLGQFLEWKEKLIALLTFYMKELTQRLDLGNENWWRAQLGS
jgi:hypothetical protein